MSTQSLSLVQQQSLAYAQSLGAIDATDDRSFTAQWFTTLKLGLNTAQTTLEQLRTKVERTNSQLAGVQFAQSELKILLNSGAITSTATLASVLAPGETLNHADWSQAGLNFLRDALGSLRDALALLNNPAETTTLEDLLANALAGDPSVLDGALGDAFDALYGFGDGAFTRSGWPSGTSPEQIKNNTTFQTRTTALASDLSALLGAPSITKNSTVADLQQAIVGSFNAVMLSQTAVGSPLGSTLMQYVGEEVTGGATKEQILGAGDFQSDLFQVVFRDDAYSVERLFAKIDVAADGAATVDRVLARLETGHQAKSNLSTLETLDLKIASQSYSNHLSLLTKMVSDRISDVEKMLREW